MIAFCQQIREKGCGHVTRMGALILLAALSSCLLFACNQREVPEAPFTHSFIAMDTPMTVKLYATDQQTADEAASACEKYLHELDVLLAPENPQSEIALLNESSGIPVVVSPLTYNLIDKAVDVARETNGAFDPTIYPLTSAWGFTDGNHQVPSEKSIEELKNLCDFNAVKTNAADSSITMIGQTQIDTGGIAKGFAAEQLTELLAERGIDTALLDLGGNITALGTKPDHTPWNIGIADPITPDKLAGTLELQNATVSTSGAYQRFFTDDDGTVYHHIIDPTTGRPAETDLISVSVIGTDAARCDALSTALYVMGCTRALEFCSACKTSENDAIQAVLITKDATIHVTANLADTFIPAEAYAAKTVIEP